LRAKTGLTGLEAGSGEREAGSAEHKDFDRINRIDRIDRIRSGKPEREVLAPSSCSTFLNSSIPF
jgi:hypothetical protein